MTRRFSSPHIVKFLGVGERQIRVVASDGSVDRMGDVLVPWGVDLANFKRNPIVLAQHDSSKPIAKCATIGVEGDAVVALIQFPDAGVNDLSDQYLRLMKSGVLGAVSVGFIPVKQQPIDTGWKFTQWELLELSVVSVPANANALVTERSIAGDHGYQARLARAKALRQRLNDVTVPPKVNAERARDEREDFELAIRRANVTRRHHEVMHARRLALDAAMRGPSW
jgi:HK97 family phage prohead protease